MNFKTDFYRMTGTKYEEASSKIITFLFQHNLRFVYWYRKYQNTHNVIYKFFMYLLSRKYGLEISSDAIIEEGLYLGHPYNITVADGVHIGRNVNLHKGCTIGRENRGKRAGVPMIGNRVFVGVNATIVGNCKIGDDVMIAPNTFINFDVPDHSIVIGNPGVVYRKTDATAGYVNFLV